MSDEESAPPPSSDSAPPPSSEGWSPGIVGMFGLLIGMLTLVIGILSIVNAGLGLDLALDVSGAEVALPRFMDGAVSVTIMGVVVLAATTAGSYLIHLGQRTKSWPIRIAMIAGVTLTIGLGSYYGYWLLEWYTFGSWAVAYAANGSVDAMVAELDAGVPEEVEQSCLRRAIYFEEAETVGVLLARGIEPVRALPDGETWCVLEDADESVLEAAAAAGWSATCERVEEPGSGR